MFSKLFVFDSYSSYAYNATQGRQSCEHHGLRTYRHGRHTVLQM